MEMVADYEDIGGVEKILAFAILIGGCCWCLKFAF